jgi:CubicO group peptidase (beta-lactamase class C family)
VLTQRLIELSCFARYVLLNAVYIADCRVFPGRELANAARAFHFSTASGPDALLQALSRAVPGKPEKGRTGTLDDYLERHGTTAFVVIQNDRLLIERYYNGFEHDSVCTSFSTAKSFVSAMIGAALYEKLMDRLDDPLTHYLPELSSASWSAISIRHLISMSSRIAYD